MEIISVVFPKTKQVTFIVLTEVRPHFIYYYSLKGIFETITDTRAHRKCIICRHSWPSVYLPLIDHSLFIYHPAGSCFLKT